MSWELVALTLGLGTLAVAVYALRMWRSASLDSEELAALKTSLESMARAVEGTSTRVAKIEAALRIDGSRIMAEANKSALPAFMR